VRLPPPVIPHIKKKKNKPKKKPARLFSSFLVPFPWQLLASDWESRKLNHWLTPCNCSIMLCNRSIMCFAGEQILCFQTRSTGYQYSTCLEIQIICHLVSACICYRMLQQYQDPCHHRNCYSTFLIRGGLLLLNAGGNSFFKLCFWNESPQLKLTVFTSCMSWSFL